MHFVFLLPAILGIVLAQGQPQKACTTKYGTVSLRSVPTTNRSFTKTETVTKLVKVTPSKTQTPAAVMSTVATTRKFTTSITKPIKTNTYTTSKTVTRTKTATETESFTQTETVKTTVTISSTTTVQPPAGFTALADEPGFLPRRNAVIQRRDAFFERSSGDVVKEFPLILAADGSSGNNAARALPSPSKSSSTSKTSSKATSSKTTSKKSTSTSAKPSAMPVALPQYPSSVICQVTTTKTSTTTSTTTLQTMSTAFAPTPTNWSTTTLSTTITKNVVLADQTFVITVPITTRTTVTTTQSTTTTKTDTETIYAPSATYYAQCDVNNQVSSALGQSIGTISFNPAFTLQSLYPDDKTGYGCCAACASSPVCAGYGQHPNGACYFIATDGRCDGTQSWGNKFHYYNTIGAGYVIGNGACGYLNPQAG